MNLNKIYFNEDLTVLSKTEQPIRAYAQQANTIEVCAPVSGYNTAYIIFQGLASGVVNPRLRATQRLFMTPLSDEGTYKRWNMVIPGSILNDMSLMNSTGVRVLVEFWYISGDCIGIKKYNTEVEATIISSLAADFPGATDGQFVRVVDTNTDWYYDDGTSTWIDYEGQYQVGASKQPTSVADFTLEKGIYTDEPSHSPTNTEYILSEITSINADVVAAQADIVTLETTAVTLEADKHEYSALVGASGEVKTKDTPVYTKLKEDELLAANSVTDQAYTDTEIDKIEDGTYTADKATKDGDGNIFPNTYPKFASNNVMTGQNQFQGDTYFLPASNPLSIGVKIDKTNATVEILYSGATWAKLDKNGLYLNPTYVTEAASDNYTPSKAMVDGYISTHDELTTAHEYIRGLIQAVEQEIARLDGRGKSYGEIAYTTAELLAMNTETRDAAINAAIVAGYGGATYTPTNTDLVYDTGIGDGVQYHEWEYNGTNWVDNGEYINAKASDSVFGLVKGNEYITIISGIMQVLKSDYATNLGTSGAYYTYTNIYDALARLTQAEADIADHETRIGTAESEIDALQDNISDLDDANLNESHSRMSPALLGTITNGTPVTDAYWNGRLNEIRLKGLTVAQLIKNGNFVTTVNWTYYPSGGAITFNVENNVGYFSASDSFKALAQIFSIVFGNTYLIKFKAKASANCTMRDGFSSSSTISMINTYSVTTEWQQFSGLISTSTTSHDRVILGRTNVSVTLYLSDIQLIDLTALGTHPTLGVAWSSLTAEQVSAYIGNYKTNAEIVAEQTTNLVTNGTFATTSNWTVDASTFTVSSNTANITATAQYGGIYQNFSIVSGKNYAIVFEYLATQSNIKMIERISNATSVSTTLPAVTVFTTYSYFITANRTDTTGRVGFLDFNASGFTQFQIKNVQLYDITDSARTSGLYSFKPTAITSTDGSITRTLDLSGLGRMNSLPSGIKDEFDTYVSTSTGERVHEHTLRTMRINLPTGSGWTAGTVGASFSQFYIDLGTYDGGQTLTLPADDTDLPDAFQHIGYVPTAFTDFQTLNPETPTVAGSCITPGGIYHIVLPNATADTLAELYTYLAANPILIVIAMTEAVETNVIGYLKQTGTAMTIDVTSDTFVNESGFSVKYVKDLQVVIDAIIASIPA